jgi:hypothetical protein
MRERLAAAWSLAVEQISVKATTNERLGFIGRGEGIAALAVAMLQRSDEEHDSDPDGGKDSAGSPPAGERSQCHG